MISESGSSVFEGSVASAASSRIIKESKTVERQRKAIFWTPVMVWPVGFVKKHSKETKEYLSSDCLHIDRWPPLPQGLTGGIIINLETKDVEQQVSKLLQREALVADDVLCRYLTATIDKIKGCSYAPGKAKERQSSIQLMESVLM